MSQNKAKILYKIILTNNNVDYFSQFERSMDFQTLGHDISRFRQQQGVSQQQMADHLGISRATINALENSRSGDIGIRKVMKILDYLGKELTVRDKSPFPTLEELRDER